MKGRFGSWDRLNQQTKLFGPGSVRFFCLLSAVIVCLAFPGISGQNSGVAIDKVYAPVHDEHNRPITAGGFTEGGAVIFEDVTSLAGLDRFHHTTGSADKRYILEVPSGGVALFDYDNDGLLDVYLVNGSTLEALAGKEPHPSAALFRNTGKGHFEEVTARARVNNQRWGFGATVGDYNNDGRPDLYVTNFGKNRLYKNNGNGTFTDVAEQAGVSLGVWSTAAAFGDYDRDGLLDLFVAGYLDFKTESPPEPGSPEIGNNFCQYRGRPVLCGPRGLKGTRDFLFRNNGDGTFTEVSSRAGVADEAGYYGFAAAWVDIDQDGWLDLAVANDSTPNYLYRNRANGTFENFSFPAGFALNEYGREQAGMGLAVGDYNNDGQVDFYMTHFSDDYNTLYHNEGSGFFTDLTFQLGLGETTIPFLGWGTGFLDFDNDGFKDLFVANGHVYPEVDRYDWGTSWAQRPLLFQNLKGKKFAVVPAVTGSGLALVVAARGAAFGDLDNDGRVDVVINCADQSPRVLRNVTEEPGNWLSLQLEGGEKSPRDAIGATVFVTVNGVRLRGDVVSGGSYASHSDLRLHFGLGQADKAEQVEIRWPSGRRQVVKDVKANQILKIREALETEASR